MAMNLRLQPKMAQQLVMTPQLQQAIGLLQLSHLEMAAALREEIAQNPVLEDDMVGAEVCLTGLGAAEPSGAAQPPDEPRATDSWASLRDGLGPRGAAGADGASIEATCAGKESLADHLHWQVSMAGFDPHDRTVAHFLVEEIDDNGYLASDAEASACELLGTTPARVASVLKIVQGFDPLGVGARNLRECLLAQAAHAAAPAPLAVAIIEGHLQAVPRRATKEIAKQLGAAPQAVHEAIRFIGQLDPHPGRAFLRFDAPYIVPDIYVREHDASPDGFVVTLNDEALPRLKISAMYAEGAAASFAGEARAYVQEKLRSAQWLMRSVAMRQKTICRVMQSILRFQRDFFTEGPHALKPLILRDVAADVGLHESTISRVTSNKFVHTSQGLFELKYFFNSTIQKTRGPGLASASVRSHIERLIAKENKHEPLSDQKIVDLLRQSDISIARRTVAKYRKMLRKDSSCARKRHDGV